MTSVYTDTDYYTAFLPYTHRLSTWHFVPKLSPGPRILDYGCGTADMVAWLLPRYRKYKFTVADVAGATHLNFVRWRLRHSDVEVIEIDHDFTPPPLTEKYDLIVCSGVLHWLPDPLTVVKHLTDHLEPDGLFLFDFPVESELVETGGAYLPTAVEARPHVEKFLNEHFRSKVPMRHADPGARIVNWEARALYENSLSGYVVMEIGAN